MRYLNYHKNMHVAGAIPGCPFIFMQIFISKQRQEKFAWQR
jgi:hypothetical protein